LLKDDDVWSKAFNPPFMNINMGRRTLCPRLDSR
jgi:hypothetical protein